MNGFWLSSPGPQLITGLSFLPWSDVGDSSKSSVGLYFWHQQLQLLGRKLFDCAISFIPVESDAEKLLMCALKMKRTATKSIWVEKGDKNTWNLVFFLPLSLKVLLCITYTSTFELNGSSVLKIAEVSAAYYSLCLFTFSHYLECASHTYPGTVLVYITITILRTGISVRRVWRNSYELGRVYSLAWEGTFGDWLPIV